MPETGVPDNSQNAQAAPFVTATMDASGIMRWLPTVPAVVEEAIVAALEEIGAFAETVAVDESPEGALGGAGGLRGSVFHEVHGFPARELVFGWAAPYAEFVARGRRPGQMPPTAPIALWVRKVLDVPEEKSLSVAFAIARAIGRRGTRGNDFIQRTLLRVEPVANQILARRAEELGRRLSR